MNHHAPIRCLLWALAMLASTGLRAQTAAEIDAIVQAINHVRFSDTVVFSGAAPDGSTKETRAFMDGDTLKKVVISFPDAGRVREAYFGAFGGREGEVIYLEEYGTRTRRVLLKAYAVDGKGVDIDTVAPAVSPLPATINPPLGENQPSLPLVSPSVLPAAAAVIAPTAPTTAISGYLETYYLYDFLHPATHNHRGFVYTYTRHNEVSLNLGYIKAVRQQGNTRATLALMTGTYANANLASEPGVLKNIYEAGIAVKLGAKSAKTRTIWLETGVLTSHIGLESAVGKDCWTLTRSLSADNSPYYESGARITRTSGTEKWLVSAMYLNGWQHIVRADGNNTPAFGTQVTYTPSAKIKLNSSAFIGNEYPDSLRRMRYFHDAYAIIALTPRIGLQTVFDIGAEQRARGSKNYAIWYAATGIVRFALSDTWHVAGRVEAYHDVHEVIVQTGTPQGFRLNGYSLNIDYALAPHALWRLEGRLLNSRDMIFATASATTNKNAALATSMCISF